MNIYTIAVVEYAGYDSYSGHVVIAGGEDEARGLCPGGDEVGWDDNETVRARTRVGLSPRWPFWMNPAKTTCTLIGEARPHAAAHVVLSSFHAG